MARQPKQMHGDLREVFRGDVLLDEFSRALYATDASIFRQVPSAVVAPRDEADVLNLIRYATEAKLTLTPRGGGTGLAGESLSTGVVVDMSRYFQQIISFKDDCITLQCGAVPQRINEWLLPHGQRLPVELGSNNACTIGGMIATNASGAGVLREGYLRDHIIAVNAALANGESAQFHQLPHCQATPVESRSTMESLAFRAWQILARNRSLIAECQPRTPFNRCGYLLHDLIRDHSIDLHKLFVGAEGTLGIVTQATLRTVPISTAHVALLLGFSSLTQAACQVASLLKTTPHVLDLLDRRVITLAGEADPTFKRQVHPQAQAVILVMWEGDRLEALLRQAQRALQELQHAPALLSERLAVQDEAASLWRNRITALPALHSPRTSISPIPFLEDVAVPVVELVDFLDSIQRVLQKHALSCSIMAHAGAGIVHLRPLLNLQDPGARDAMWKFTEDVYQEVLKRGGTISAQHGMGLARAPWVARQAGPLLNIWREIKDLFDPTGLLNPGKWLNGISQPLNHLRFPIRNESAADAPAETPDDSTPHGDRLALPVLTWRLHWPREQPVQEVASCNGCGACRTHDTRQRMCPIFRVSGEEAASPRAKANLMRDILLDSQPRERFSSPEVKQIAQLCVNCKMCAVECPAQVDIPKLMLEARAQHVAEAGLSWQDWLLSRIDNWARWGSALSWFANPLLRSEPVRWVLEKTLGLSRRRRLPPFAADSFLKRARRYGWTHPTQLQTRPRVVYFPDTYANFFDPDLAEATVHVLHAAGVEVYVPPEPLVSGAAALAVGHTARAKRIAQRNINLLTDLTRQGYTVLCSEPTAALMLRQDYLHLLNDPAAEQVGRNTVDLMWYLRELQSLGRLPPAQLNRFSGLLAHHVPCHVKALRQGTPGPELLQSMAGLKVDVLDVSCSGMAGAYGLAAPNYHTSLAAGKPMLDRFKLPQYQFGSSECSACRLQMSHVAKKPVLHPVQYLAWSMGLMPQLEKRLSL